MAEAYGVVHEGRPFPERWTFYIDKEGVIKMIDQKVSPKDSGKDLVKNLEDLGFPKKK